MAYSRFSGKSQSSLVRRILFVCLILLVVPLILDSLLVYVHEYQARMRTFYISLNLVSEGQENVVNEIIENEIEKLTDLKSDEGVFVTPESGIFVAQMEQTLKTGSLIFAALDPKTAQKMIYIAKTVEGGRVRLVGIPATEFVAHLSRLPGRPFDFHMGIFLPDGSLYIADDPDVNFDDIEYLSTPYKNKNFFEIMQKRFSKIGLKKPWKGTDLFFVFAISTEAVRSAAAFSWLSNFLLIFFAIFLLGFVMTYLITRRMARPLGSLCLEMSKVGSGDLKARYKYDPFGLEINTLGESFNQMIDSLILQIEISKNERVAKEALETELKIGKKIQKSLLPTRLVEFPGVDIGAGFQAAQEVAGDFYDLFVINNKLMVAVGDASGKGISACLYSLGVRSLLRSFNLCYSNQLSKALDATNAIFCKDTEDTQHFVTAWVGIFDPATLQLEYGSAGHPPALLKRKNGEVIELATPGIAFGAVEEHSIETKHIQLVSGDLLLLYSDGITEAQDVNDQFYGAPRLERFLQAQNMRDSASALAQNLLQDVEQFSINTAQYDDVTFLFIRIL
ncbi:MAG: SpoIIE family protein phosphatase [Chlamydiota bacterium]